MITTLQDPLLSLATTDGAHLQRAHQARMTLASARARATDSPRGTP